MQREAYRRFRRSTADLVARAIAQGRLAATHDPVTEAESLIALTDGIAVQALFDPDSWPPERQRAHLRRALDALQA